MLLASGSGNDPWTIDKRRLMSHMLSMATGQLSHPIAVFVLVISSDRLLHIPKRLASRK
jgi:hypothetical protein